MDSFDVRVMEEVPGAKCGRAYRKFIITNGKYRKDETSECMRGAMKRFTRTKRDKASSPMLNMHVHEPKDVGIERGEEERQITRARLKGTCTIVTQDTFC